MNFFDELVEQMIDEVDNASTGYVMFELSIPQKLLQANSGQSGHWSKKSKATAKARDYAYLIARSDMYAGLLLTCPWTHATARETYFFPCKAGRDERNATASTKAYWDGIVDAGLLANDMYENLRHIPPRFDIDKKNPRLVIQIWNTSEAMKG